MKHVLVLPRWYPNKTDIQLGIFIQRQLLLMQKDCVFTVVFIQFIEELDQTFKIETSKPADQLTEHIIYVKRSAGFARKITNFIRFYRAQKLGLKQISIRIDACHIHVPYRTVLPALALKRHKKTPFYITEHWSGHLNGLYLKKNKIDQFLYRYTLKKATKISTVSTFLQLNFKENTGFSSQVIPNLIEMKTASQPKAKNNDQIDFLVVGDFIDSIKNLSGILHAFVAAQKINPRLRLTLIGGGPDFERLKQLGIALSPIEDSFLFLGRQTHDFVLEAIQSCDGYICNSRFETFGMTVAEALLAGKPVISTLCGGPNDFLTPENSIRLQPDLTNDPESIKKLTAAILEMAANYKSYNPKEISAPIQKRFGASTIREQWKAFYEI